MQVTQDDLFALHHLRAAWFGGAAERKSEAALAAYPGRAEGRVAWWSYRRAAICLARYSRRAVVLGDTLAPSSVELRLIHVARALSAGDWQAAEAAAQWLVRKPGLQSFLEGFAPAAASAYGNALPRRTKAATA